MAVSVDDIASKENKKRGKKCFFKSAIILLYCPFSGQEWNCVFSAFLDLFMINVLKKIKIMTENNNNKNCLTGY